MAVQALSPYVAAASPAGCQPALLRYVMDFAQGLQSESSSRCAPPAVCPLVAVGALVHQQPATPPMSPGPVQEEEQVTLTLQHEQTQHTATTQHTSAQPRLQPQAEDKEDEGQPRGCRSTYHNAASGQNLGDEATDHCILCVFVLCRLGLAVQDGAACHGLAVWPQEEVPHRSVCCT